MKKAEAINDRELDELLEENKSEEFAWNKNKVIINNVTYYRQSIVTDTSTKSTAQSLIKKEAEFDYNYCEELYTELEAHKLDHIIYARPANSVFKNDSFRANLQHNYQLDLYSAYPHILKYEKLPVAGDLYTEEIVDMLNFYKYKGKYLTNNCIVTDDLKQYIEANGLGSCEYMFSTNYKIGSKLGDKLIDMVYKNKKTKQDAKQIHYGFYQKKYIEYDMHDDCYIRNEAHKYEILMIAVLSQLVYIMLNIRDIIGDDCYHFVTDAYFFDNLDDIDDIVARLKARFSNYDYRIIDCTIPSEEDKHGTIIYKSYPDLPDAPRSHHKKKVVENAQNRD